MKKMTKAQEIALFGPEDHEGKIVRGGHTPGPWKWWTSCSWRRLLNEDGSKHILQPTNHPIDRHPDIIVTDADMRLIGAAPELLEALRGVLESGFYGKLDNRMMAARVKAHAAIKKAEGRE